MSEKSPRERLNDAAQALGLPERLPPEYGQAAWTDVLTRIVVALAESARETREALSRRAAPVRKRRVAKSPRLKREKSE